MFFPDEPVPLEVVRELAALLATNGLSELTLESKSEENPLRLSLERETRVYAVASTPVLPESIAASSTVVEMSSAALPEAQEQGTTTEKDSAHEVGAPYVGIYRTPKKPLQIGDSVVSGQVIAVVESLHVRNEVLAPFDARVLELPVLAGEGVEWGQTLVILEPAS